MIHANLSFFLDFQITIDELKVLESSAISDKVLTIFVKELGVVKKYEFNGSTRECVNVLLLDETGYLPATIHNPIVMKLFRQGNYYRLYGKLTYDSNKKMMIINSDTIVSLLNSNSKKHILTKRNIKAL